MIPSISASPIWTPITRAGLASPTLKPTLGDSVAKTPVETAPTDGLTPTPDAFDTPSLPPGPVPDSTTEPPLVPDDSVDSPDIKVTTDAPEDLPDGKGVLRLLEAGHFRGVADLRLRMNFAEELEGRELPELSQPRGNGKAYAKFLAQYDAPDKPTKADDETDRPPVRLDEAA